MEEIDHQRDTVYLSLECRQMADINHFIHTFSSQHTIHVLKSIITQRSGVVEDQQRLFFRGVQIEDDQPLVFYSVVDYSIIHIDLRLLGGAKTRRTYQINDPSALVDVVDSENNRMK